MISIRERVARAADRLRAAGIREAELDARLLAQTVLGWDTARLLIDSGEPEPPDFEVAYEALVTRRSRREPMAYIIGHREFWGLTFEVSRGVLIPRPETEIIVEVVLELFADKKAPFHAADVCTGSGCLAVALAHERPAARIDAGDTSDEALRIAARNVAANGVASRVSLVQSDLLDRMSGPFDVIVSNPPYVAGRDRRGLTPEVRDYEPAIALFGGDDGLELLRRLVDSSADRLKPDGVLVFEFGFGQGDAVTELIENAAALRMDGLRTDLQGLPRVAIARKAQHA